MGALRRIGQYRAGLAAERIRLLRLLPSGGAVLTAVLCVAHLVTAVLPTLTAIAVGYLVSLVVGQGGIGRMVGTAAGLGALLFAGQLAETVRELLRAMLARRIDGRVRATVRRLATAPAGIAHLETPSFRDDASRASDLGLDGGRGRSAGTAAVGQLTLMFRLLAAALAAGLLATFSVLLAAALLAASLTVRAILRRQWMHLAGVFDAGAAGQRRVLYWTELAVTGAPKEVRLFGLARWIGRRYRAAAFAASGPAWREMWLVLRRQWWTAALVAGSAAAALGALGLAALAGRIDAQQMVTYLLAAWGVLTISSMGFEAYDIEYGLGAVRAMDRLSARYGRVAPRLASMPPAPSRPSDRPPLVRFEDVVFVYPGARRPVLDGFSLTLHPGETLALVGGNGAGKSTAVKLLAGLYPPTAGRITVDGTDLAELDLHAWRRHIAAVFQDFIHFPASLADNVALAAPERLGDTHAVAEAIRRAGATALLDKLPDGVDTLLWREGSRGVDLSGGQWQRLALARALFAVAAGRRLLVLDEPTAHLDIPAEAAFHSDIVRSVAGVTTVLISHRLSTVRPADRIALIQHGRVEEEGTHDKLLASNGEYSRFFRLQAETFGSRP